MWLKVRHKDLVDSNRMLTENKCQLFHSVTSNIIFYIKFRVASRHASTDCCGFPRKNKTHQTSRYSQHWLRPSKQKNLLPRLLISKSTVMGLWKTTGISQTVWGLNKFFQRALFHQNPFLISSDHLWVIVTPAIWEPPILYQHRYSFSRQWESVTVLNNLRKNILISFWKPDFITEVVLIVTTEVLI